MKLINIKVKKLTEEDRRFLLNKNLFEITSNWQGTMSNNTLFFSLLAVTIAGFSIVYQTKVLWIILAYIILSLLGIFWSIAQYWAAQNELKKERDRLKLDYDSLFEHHVAYATGGSH
jgi:hypothetical protein